MDGASSDHCLVVAKLQMKLKKNLDPKENNRTPFNTDSLIVGDMQTAQDFSITLFNKFYKNWFMRKEGWNHSGYSQVCMKRHT